MHPEQAPGPDDAPKPATGGTSRAARPDSSAGEQRENTARDESAGSSPRDPEENPALHTATNFTPVDHAMVESLGVAVPPGTHPVPEAAPADAAVSAEAGSTAVGSSCGASSAPANLTPAKPGSTRKKKRRKRAARFDWESYVPPPPIPLDPVARSYWNLHLAHRSCFKLLTDRWMLARYCSYLSLWVMTRQVLDSKGLVYVRHQRARGNGQLPVESIRALPHADYLMRLEYVLIQHERALGIDRHDIFTMTNRQTGPTP